jgi:hypothetical protein
MYWSCGMAVGRDYALEITTANGELNYYYYYYYYYYNNIPFYFVAN